MKKILALVLAIIMMAALAVPAFAAAGGGEIDQEGDEPKTETVEVKYGVDQTYVISIPADVDFTSLEYSAGYSDDRTLEATNVIIEGDQTLSVAVKSAHEWTMPDKNGNGSVAVIYELKTKTTEAGSFGAKLTGSDFVTILSVDAAEGNQGIVGNSGKVWLNFWTLGTAQEGQYLDTLTFQASIA